MGERGSLLIHRPRAKRRTLWNLRLGLGSLPIGVAEKLGPRVRLNAAVTELRPSQGGWTVQGEAFEAVVLALPAAPAAKLSRAFAPQFADALAEFHAAPVTLVHLGLPGVEVPRGFGMLDGDGALHALGTLFPSSMLPGRAPEGKALVTAICGGALHPERASLPDQELTSFVRADLLSTLGVRSEPDYVRVVRHPAAIPQYATGHRDRVRAARLLLANLPSIELAGASYDGVSVPDVARSGAAAAARLLAER
jgi:oxygen-dependent protoporphyrinogen oxidase